MTNQELADSITELRKEVAVIRQTLDELTGAKKFLMWFTGFLVGAAGVVVLFITNHKTK